MILCLVACDCLSECNIDDQFGVCPKVTVRIKLIFKSTLFQLFHLKIAVG